MRGGKFLNRINTKAVVEVMRMRLRLPVAMAPHIQELAVAVGENSNVRVVVKVMGVASNELGEVVTTREEERRRLQGKKNAGG
ncbi:hypothetical protein HRI_000071600 [Hibiscus trionum]|uniref:Uncharacterized protein n=1 Tax=Hibiscus trionum TaxID=183268 RepID=A0A9W7LGD9_HIBTR|nr:hypothetical protein HRI_000071600 [Hibiscus trionum]